MLDELQDKMIKQESVSLVRHIEGLIAQGKTSGVVLLPGGIVIVWKDVRDGSAGKQIVEAVRRFTKKAT